MGTIVLRAQTDGCHPLIDKPSILARTQVLPLTASAGKDEIIQRATPTLQPCQHRRARRFHDLELNRFAGLLLDDNRTWLHFAAADNVADLQFDEVATSQFTIYGEINKGSIAKPMFMIEVKANGPDLLDLEGALGTDKPTGVPWRAVVLSGVILRATHDVLLMATPPSDIERPENDPAISPIIQIDGRRCECRLSAALYNSLSDLNGGAKWSGGRCKI